MSTVRMPHGALPSKSEIIAERVGSFIQKNFRSLLIAIALIFVAVLVLLIVHSFNEEKERKANADLERGISAYSMMMNTSDAGMRMQYMNEAVNRLSTSEKKAAGSTTALRATFYKGLVYYQAGNYTSAVMYFKKTGRENRFYLAPQALLHLMWSYTAMGNYEEAAATFNRLKRHHAASYLYGEAVLSASRIYKQLGDGVKAVDVLKTFLEEHPDDEAYSQVIKERIGLLETKVY